MEFLESPLHDRMIFLVGARRSGTNWLFRLLTIHPMVAGIPSETYLFALGLSPLAGRFHQGVASSALTGTVYLERAVMLRSFRDLADTAFGGVASRIKPNASRVLEHSPGHARHLDLIREVYPDAWVVHIIRDGRDVAASLVRQPWGPATLAEAADEWSSSIREARASAPPRYREVRYEELMADPAAGTRELFEWLGLPCSADLLEAVGRESNRAFNVDVSNPAIREGKWRASFTASEAAQFDLVAGALRRELGYPDITTTRSASQLRLREVMETPKSWARQIRRHRERAAQLSVTRRFHLLLDLANTIIETIQKGEIGQLAPLLSADVKVRVMGSGNGDDSDADALSRLAQVVKATAPLQEVQTRGDVYPDPSGFTAVLTYGAEDTPSSCCVLVVRADPQADRPIQEIAYHWFSAHPVTEPSGRPGLATTAE